MKERPILMSAPMVRACLDGSKTQTRRIAPVESFDIKDAGNEMVTWAIKFSKAVGPSRSLASYSGGRYSADDAARIVASQFCPYGKPGDRLWVRETWREDSPDDPEGALYRATDTRTMPLGFKWKPSIFMPRWACRLELEITGVRVERLQECSEGDAKAEGIEPINKGIWWKNYVYPGGPQTETLMGEPIAVVGFRDPRKSYSTLWDQINGAGAWATNPWVWVVEFKRVKP